MIMGIGFVVLAALAVLNVTLCARLVADVCVLMAIAEKLLEEVQS